LFEGSCAVVHVRFESLNPFPLVIVILDGLIGCYLI